MHNLLQGSALKYRAPASTHSSAIEEAAAVCVAPPGVFFPPVTVAVANALARPPADSAQDDLLQADCSEAVASPDFRAQAHDRSAPEVVADDSAPQAVLLVDCSEPAAEHDSRAQEHDRSALVVVVDDSAPQVVLLDDCSAAAVAVPDSRARSAPAVVADGSVPQAVLRDDYSEPVAEPDFQAAR
ncbi:MAG: hypothetical protein DMG81_20895 [Acidobacteria bacterium]|nr:MAG: hypothetical protein DMG81_20895 [Acidobacteriota bacterium]